MTHRRLLLAVFLAGSALAAPAAAYIDPSAGSYLLQILAAGFFGAMFALRIFWDRIKSFFSRRAPETTEAGGGAGGAGEEGDGSASG
jgi:hypothetical protein